MNRNIFIRLGLVLTSVTMLLGCHPTQPFYLGERHDLANYLDTATDISYPDVDEPSLEDVIQSKAPLTLSDPEFQGYWDLTLEEVISIAMQNSKIIRAGGQAPSIVNCTVGLVTGESLTSNTEPGSRFQATIYDPAIKESEGGQPTRHLGVGGDVGQLTTVGSILSSSSLDSFGRTGGTGVESALAEFDAQLRSSFFWNKTDRPQNNRFANFFSAIQEQDTATWQAEIAKKSATGTQSFLRTNVNYQNSNSPILALPSSYTTELEAEVRHPLLRGRGALINRMPIIISRIGTDQQIDRFEAQMQNYLVNVEMVYWDLYCAYRQLEAAKMGRDAALHAWRRVYTLYKGGQQIRSQDEAQSREQYFAFRVAMEQSLCVLYETEARLRWLMGIASTDNRLIRPIDEPTKAKIEFDWHDIQTEALVRRPVVRQQKWEIKKKELSVVYAKNGLLPQMNVVALYRWLGLGDELTAADGRGLDFPAVGSLSTEELLEGNFQELRVGVTFDMPIGFRRELANVRNAQLKLARERAFMEDLELDVTRELTQAVRALDTQYYVAQTHLNRWVAANTEVEGRTEILEKIDSRELDLLLNAQRRQAQAQADYYTSLCEYNKIIAVIHRRKGSTLEYSGVHLAEGPWSKKAYWDAKGESRRRSAGHRLHYGWTRPGVISRGPVPQRWSGHGEQAIDPAEVIPTPEPTPAAPPMSEIDEMGGPSPAIIEGPMLFPASTSQAKPLRSGPDAPLPASGKWGNVGLHVPAVGTGVPKSVLRQASHAE